MKTANLLSIIIPTYNRANYLADAIESVTVQDFGIYTPEIIVVDDGSTDNTEEVIKKFKDKIKYIKIPHSGLPAVARNVGLKEASGGLIAFQDSDDLWHKDKLTNQLKIFEDKSIVFSFGQAMIMDQNGVISDRRVVDERALVSATSFPRMLTENVVCTLTVMIRKEVLDSVGLFNEQDELRAIEDYDLWLRVANAFPKGIKPLNKILAYYRRHGQNISVGDNLKGIENALTVYSSSWENTNLTEKNRRDLEEQAYKMESTWSNHKNELSDGNRPLVTIVMTVYNAGKFLKPAIDSILSQTYKNFEFIIINDGSTDNSEKVIKSYVDPRIRFINQTNHGLAYSLNKGFSLARGEFIARMDQDDISLPSRLEKELQLIALDPTIGVVGTFFTYIDEETSSPSITITMPTLDIDLKRTLYLVNPFGHGSTMIRKTAWEQAGGYRTDYGPTEDNILWATIADNWAFRVIPEVLYWYRINTRGMSALRNAEQQEFAKKIINEQWEKPFIRKGIRQTVTDGRYYKRMNSLFSEHVYNQYLGQQFSIMRKLYTRKNFIAGLRTALPLIWLRPRLMSSVLRTTTAGFLHRIGLRKYGQ